MMKNKRYLSFLALSCLVLIGIACGPKMPLVEKWEPKAIGAPVKSVNWVRPHFGLGQQGEPRIYVTMGQQGDNFFLLKVDPATGALEQFIATGEKANYPTATLMSQGGILYVGGSYAGHLYAFDPAKNALEDLGAINPEKAVFPCGIQEDKNGVIWIGSYGTADLTSFDPKTREFTRHGRMDEVDMYNYPLINADGMICCQIMQTQPKLVVFDPKTKKKEVVGPVATKNKDTFSIQKDEKGRVYIASSLGNFRIEGFKAVPVKDVPPRPEPKPFQGIKSVKFVGGEIEPYRKMEVTREDGSRVFDLKYEVAGTDIFYIHRGPDDLIYGSSILPLHIFRYTPQTGELVDQGGLPGGEAYSMGNLNGLIYILAYTGAEIYSYDPAKPFKFKREDPESNPKDLGRMDTVSYRPRSTLTGPLGRVWVASIPDYGLWGGPLSWYDPKTGEKKAYYDIAGEASCYTLAHLEKTGLIAVGTTIDGGSGTLPKVQQASLFLWDPAAENKAWEGTLDSSVHAFNALVALPDGRIIGTVTAGETGKPALFVFNSESRRFEKTFDLPEGNPLDLGLQLGPDGYVYGFTTGCFYRIEPKSLKVEELLKAPEEFEVAGPILGKDIYYAKGWVLKALPLFK